MLALIFVELLSAMKPAIIRARIKLKTRKLSTQFVDIVLGLYFTGTYKLKVSESLSSSEGRS